jgi:hypothetical protein
MANIPTAPAQVGSGKALHHVRKDAFHARTIGCQRTVSRELTEREATGRKECGPCKRAMEALAAEQAPAATELAPPAAETTADAEAAEAADIERHAHPLAAPHRAEPDDQAHRAELETEVAARTLVISGRITAHGFQPVHQPDGERIAWTFRTGHGARARYRWVSTRGAVGPGDGHEYRWQAERTARHARRIGLDETPLPEHIAGLLTEPTESLERIVACLDQDTVHVQEDRPGHWVVKRGGTFLGTVHDEGARMRRGRYAAWSPYAERRDGNAGFHQDLDAARDAVAAAWPVEVAEIAGELGVPVDRVLETAEQVGRDWQHEGRRAVLHTEAHTGTDSRVTQDAAAEVRRRLAAPAPGMGSERAARA